MEISFLPSRGVKPRTSGVTMVMDKGLYECQVEGLCKISAPTIDFVKLGFGTSVFSGHLAEKLAIYRKYGVEIYPGGTLFEAFYIRGELAKYERFVDQLGLTTIEISDGSIILDHAEKCRLIEHYSKKYTVLSEVGSKVAGADIAVEKWVEMMSAELAAGSCLVIAEAREAGNVGIFDAKGGANEDMINCIASNVPMDKILWEAPTKAQQVWFVKHFGSSVNLGNIAADEVISLETIRCGLRGDTFALHLPENLKSKVQ